MTWHTYLPLRAELIPVALSRDQIKNRPPDKPSNPKLDLLRGSPRLSAVSVLRGLQTQFHQRYRPEPSGGASANPDISAAIFAVPARD
ncbi:MAG TPA: hypothetical protein VI756_19260 [Blastocatellia bacterium]